MIKSELVTKLAEQTNLTKTDAENVVSTVFKEITKALIKGNRVELRGFGVLSVRERKPRIGRNPKTGEKIKISETKIPAFKFGKAYKDSFN
jgi:integration host factor subunit beta